MEKIESSVPLPTTRSMYADVLFTMGIGDSIVVRSVKRLNGYRMAARRYRVAIRTAQEGRFTRLWVLGRPDAEDKPVTPTVKIEKRKYTRR
jgi:hypothetical protein